MISKVQKVIEFLSAYPPWVVILSGVLVLSAGSVLVVFRPKDTTPSTLQSIADSKGSVLVVTAGSLHGTLSDAQTIRGVWKGSVSHLQNATRKDLVDELRAGHSVVHVEAEIGSDYLDLEDGRISASQLRDLFAVNSTGIDLVVLSACQSFQIGKALEDSGVGAALVATDNLPVDVAKEFYSLFYSELASETELRTAFDRAIAETNAGIGISARDTLFLSVFGSHKEDGAHR